MSTATEAQAQRSASSDEVIRKKNIRAMMMFQVLSSLAWGTAMGPVFDKYLYYLGGGFAKGPQLFPHNARNSLVGLTESISGLTCLFIAIPVGLLVDRHPDKRARLLYLGGVVGLVATAIAILAVLTDIILLIYLALMALGVFIELASSATEAIFADSIPKGERSSLFTTKAIVQSVAYGCGPLISAIGLWFIGDTWEPYQMKVIVIAGMLLMPFCCLVLFRFHDPPPFPDDTPAAESAADTSATLSQGSPQDPAPILRRCGPLKAKHVPWVLSLSNFTMAIGAGMTVKFFNLFFIQDEHFTPIQINLLQAVYPCVIAIFMKGTEKLAVPLGRPQASLFFNGCGVTCLFLMSGLQSMPWLLSVYLARGGFQNSSYPIDRSILMDFTPTTQRGMWNAVESLTSMTWSGSAFFGGLLSDSHDYRYTFLMTGIVYTCAWMVYTPLLGLVPPRESDVAVTASTNDTSARDLSVPLTKVSPTSAASAIDTSASGLSVPLREVPPNSEA